MNRMAGPEAWAAMKACFVFMSSPPIEQKKPRLCAEPQPPPSAACYPGECCASSAASAFCAAAEPAASSSSRQVFNCVGVTPGSAATLLCVAPGSDSRATDCSLYSGRKPPPRLLCHPVPPGRYLIYRLVRDPGATSVYHHAHWGSFLAMSDQAQPGGKTRINKSRVFLYLMLAIPIALMIIPTVIVLAFAMLPTGVAFIMERGKGWYGGICVGAMNLAGTASTLTERWFTGHTIDAAFAALTDVFAIILIYGAAAVGWIIYATTPNMVSAYMAMTAGRRITALKVQQKELVLKWGPDVESIYEPEDAETAKRPFRKGLSGRCRCDSRKVAETDLEPPCGRRPPESSIAARRCVIRLI